MVSAGQVGTTDSTEHLSRVSLSFVSLKSETKEWGFPAEESKARC